MNKNVGLKEQYERNGYVHLAGVLSKEEVKVLYEKILDPSRRSYVLELDFFLKHSEVYRLQFNEKISKAVEEIFGDKNILLNDINIQVEQFYNDRNDKGWHIDADGERLARYLFQPEYGYAKVGVYLKANSHGMGGGIDAEIGGQKSFRYFGGGNIGYFLSISFYLLDRVLLSRFRKKKMIETNAGDVLIFDSRLPHRSTPRRLESSEQDIPKVAIYWQVARDAKNANDYLSHSMRLACSDRNNFRHYAEFLSYKFPEDYSDGYLEHCRTGASVASLTDNLCARYKAKYPEVEYESVFFNQK